MPSPPPSPHTNHTPAPTDPPTPNDSVHGDEAPRGRLKRRRLSSHTPPRAASPSRGHDRDSGSRHRHHYRKHKRASSSSSALIETPPAAKKNRRRSDAEPDHTFRGRVRNRSESRSRSPILEGEEDRERERARGVRKRSQPPSRGREGGGEDVDNAIRRMRSYPNLYRQGAEKEKGGGVEQGMRAAVLEG
ncbi:hypothetical protein DPSP01_009089 [Paraphaeosphaeria sporulosa]|uniref:Uncharacterized protein n=1 Tax=Paraphaeosphaeria sporulosa TaxID=1460663 RepID=A0A177C834_9PLEO|nr:uncharacterized protein CC84DRAFT_872945 [Paraphaeosphaeria sporulosa]OAG03904.1 hypothetical protein CC84DRAFT_872945 [Paraphaeosphaeria sporulosa]